MVLSACLSILPTARDTVSPVARVLEDFEDPELGGMPGGGTLEYRGCGRQQLGQNTIFENLSTYLVIQQFSIALPSACCS